MNEFIEGIIKFGEASRSLAFVNDEKKVCGALRGALAAVYLDDGNEVQLVERTIEALNSNHGGHFRLESTFIHGNRSTVAFDYYGREAKKELGDLLVVSTLTNNGRPIFQKLTIVQAKRDTTKQGAWGIDKEQLFFLSNWPEFRGVRGIFPNRNLVIPDYSGCLGSYYLYREPGDFVFISAKGLEKSLGSRKRIAFDDLLASPVATGNFFSSQLMPVPIHSRYPKEMVFHDTELNVLRLIGFLPEHESCNYDPRWFVLHNIHFAKNINDTIGNFSRLNVGEPVFALHSTITVNDFAYRMLNTVVRYVARTEQGSLRQLIEYNSDAPFFQEANLDGISVGIIHTITEIAAI